MSDRKNKSQEEQDRQLLIVTPQDVRDFWDKVDVGASSDDDHWIWTGSFNNKGHPLVYIGGEAVGAYRLAWVIHHKETLASFQTMRRQCKDLRCVRPEHLVIHADRTYADHLGKRKSRKFTVLQLVDPSSEKPIQTLRDIAPAPSMRQFQVFIDRLEAVERRVQSSNRTVAFSLHTLREEIEKNFKSSLQVSGNIESEIASLANLVGHLGTRIHELAARLEPPAPEPDRIVPKPLLRLVGEEDEDQVQVTEESGSGVEGGSDDDRALDDALVRAFDQGPVSAEGMEALRGVLGLAIAESKKRGCLSHEVFFGWIERYKRVSIEGGTGPTPEGFYRAVASGSIN